MCLRKLNSMVFLAFCASLCFFAVEVEGFGFDRAKEEVCEFLGYLLTMLGYPYFDISDVQNAVNLYDMTNAANHYITAHMINEIQWMKSHEEDKHTELSEFYTEYQINFIQLLNGDRQTVNSEIPLARSLARSLCINCPMFDLVEAKSIVINLFTFLDSVNAREENYNAINNTNNFDELLVVVNRFYSGSDVEDLCEIATGVGDEEGTNQNTPGDMSMKFIIYKNLMLELMIKDPTIRGRELPFIDQISLISQWFPPREWD